MYVFQLDHDLTMTRDHSSLIHKQKVVWLTEEGALTTERLNP